MLVKSARMVCYIYTCKYLYDPEEEQQNREADPELSGKGFFLYVLRVHTTGTRLIL